eukprot:359416-Chlamydomonas_euryale.AAC.14
MKAHATMNQLPPHRKDEVSNYASVFKDRLVYCMVTGRLVPHGSQAHSLGISCLQQQSSAANTCLLTWVRKECSAGRTAELRVNKDRLWGSSRSWPRRGRSRAQSTGRHATPLVEKKCWGPLQIASK